MTTAAPSTTTNTNTNTSIAASDPSTRTASTGANSNSNSSHRNLHMIPSQAITNTNTNNTNINTININTRQEREQGSNGRRQRRRKPRQSQPSDQQGEASNTNAIANANYNENEATNRPGDRNSSGNGNMNDCNDNVAVNENVKPKRRRNRNKKNRVDQDDTATNINNTAKDAKDDSSPSNNNNNNNNKPKSKQRNRRKKRNQTKKHPWRQHLPPDAVDPISLDPLRDLTYPPFALKISPPYTPIPHWPPPSPSDNIIVDDVDVGKGDGTTKSVENDAGKINAQEKEKRRKEHEERLLREQWGSSLSLLQTKDSTSDPITAAEPPSEREGGVGVGGEERYHLFDGRVLAYYLISQLQFIDPLNRRDLTRDELVNLDDYLTRHHLDHPHNNHNHNRRKGGRERMVVVEAYDARGVTVSMAGVSGQTEGGRAEILQQEARVLLNAIFEGNLVTGTSNNGNAGNNGNADRNDDDDVVETMEGVDGGHTNNRGNHRRSDGRGGRGRGTRTGGGNRNGNSLASQYAAYSANTNTNTTVATSSDRTSHHGPSMLDEGGLLVHEGGGMLLIDDDANPGLRGGIHRNTATHNNNNTIEDGALNHEAMEFVPGGNNNNNSNSNNDTLWTSRSIVDRHGHHARARDYDFPALSTTDTSAAADDNDTTAAGRSYATARSAVRTRPNAEESTNDRRAKNATTITATTGSLSKIGNLVQKTTRKQLERQKKAREEALQRRAEMLSYSQQPMGTTAAAAVNMNMNMNGFSRPTGVEDGGGGGDGERLPTDGQLERNRKLASALGIMPTTTTTADLRSGWTRPTITNDDLSNELTATRYSDALVIKARERMNQLLKLEKKWMTFLRDDMSASCPLKSMDRPTRTFVHEYGDFWHLHTESFDREPGRYINCVKLRETRAPYPLLSDAARTWKGPSVVPIVGPLPTTAGGGGGAGGGNQPAGQPTMSSAPRSALQTLHNMTEERVPLKLDPPRSTTTTTTTTTAMTSNLPPPGIEAPPGAMFEMNHQQQPPPTTIVEEEDVMFRVNSATSLNASKGLSGTEPEPAARFAPLITSGRERTRLNLNPRTIPLELPKYEGRQRSEAVELKEGVRSARRAREERRREVEEKERKVLASAFASDDEEEEEEDSDSDWDVGEAVCTGDDEE